MKYKQVQNSLISHKPNYGRITFFAFFFRRSRSSDKLHAPKFISIRLKCFHYKWIRTAFEREKFVHVPLASFSLPVIALSIPVSTATGYGQHGCGKMFVF
jgi:hypothetical protein